MNEKVWLFYTGWGVLALTIFAGGYSLSHFFWFRQLRSIEFAAKLIGFLGLVALFLISGWKGGLLGHAIGMGVSWTVLLFFRPKAIR
jgi:hypothetical protein